MMFSKNGKLIVRSLEYSDKYLIIKWLSDSEVLKYYEGRDNPYDEEMNRVLIDVNGEIIARINALTFILNNV